MAPKVAAPALAPELEALAAEPARLRRLRLLAAGLSLGAATVHLVVSKGHVDEWWGYGAFFIVAALAQGIFGLLLLGAPWQYDDAGRYDPLRAAPAARALLAAGIALNVALVALYAVTRSVGVPLLGPEAGEVEPVDVDGMIAKAYELALIGCLVPLRRASGGRPA